MERARENSTLEWLHSLNMPALVKRVEAGRLSICEAFGKAVKIHMRKSKKSSH
ncbi:MAG TPA: hypothetical protein VMA55_20560 [Acidovorax sp.]|nr:hypothetical protein [Acidovorax sp.]